ncbi:Fur family transcriptional regulator [Planktothrix tepida]|nr:Fur family transcriptional regulator [Planktothrix tepida]
MLYPVMEGHNKTAEISQQMKEKGLRITPQRFAVYANLLSRCDHPTVDDILTEINRELPIASKASVYSALSVLREVGLVREVLLDEGVTRYDAKVEPHHHFVCEGCGQIKDLAWDVFKNLQLNPLPSGFQVNAYEITVKGCCDRCNLERVEDQNP